jgi:hypothetical protein
VPHAPEPIFPLTLANRPPVAIDLYEDVQVFIIF